MSDKAGRDAQGSGVPGWVILNSAAVPAGWRSRAIPMVLVPLTDEEADRLLADAPVEPTIAPADLELIHLVARGHTAPEIARTLNVSTRTVYRRITRLRSEFSVSSMEKLATELARRGF